MIPVDQKISDKGRGDCMRAVIASLLEFELEAVPHFTLLPGKHLWQIVYVEFMRCCGWDYCGVMNYSKTEPNILKQEDSINGYFDACVPSRNFEDTTHAVIIDMNGVVVHDPSPHKNYQGENVIKTGNLIRWYLFEKRGSENANNS